MKKIFTALATFLFSLSLAASDNQPTEKLSPYQTSLTISSMTKYPVKITIDGRNYNKKISNEVSIRNIQPGHHNIRVYRRKNNGNSNNHINYNSLQLVYNGKIYVKSLYHVDIAINRFGKAFIDERPIDASYYDEYNNDQDHDWNDNDHYPFSMNAATFEQFKQTINNGIYDDTRLTIAKQGIDANYFTSIQVKEILRLFNYENSRLEIAKYAYKKCTDKNNYFIVSNALTYSGSKEELAKFLGATGNIF